MRTVAALALAALFTNPGGLTAQGTHSPRPTPDAHRLPLQIDTFAVFLIRGGDTTRTGTVVDELRADKAQLIRVYWAADRVLGDQLDTIISAMDGLRPLAYKTHSSTRIASLAYHDAKVTGWVRLPNGDSTSVRVPLPGLVYDGASYDLVVRASNLADGVSLVAPSFIIGPNAVSPISGVVKGSAPVDGHSCWVFQANFAGMPVTFWIDKGNRALRRQLMQIQVNTSILFAHASSARPSGRAT